LVGAQASVDGGGDTIYFSGGSDDSVTLFGGNQSSPYSVYGSGGMLTLDNANSILFGNNNDIAFGEYVNFLEVSGKSESFVFQPAIYKDTINGFAASDSMQFSASDFAN